MNAAKGYLVCTLATALLLVAAPSGEAQLIELLNIDFEDSAGLVAGDTIEAGFLSPARLGQGAMTVAGAGVDGSVGLVLDGIQRDEIGLFEGTVFEQPLGDEGLDLSRASQLGTFGGPEFFLSFDFKMNNGDSHGGLFDARGTAPLFGEIEVGPDHPEFGDQRTSIGLTAIDNTVNFANWFVGGTFVDIGASDGNWHHVELSYVKDDPDLGAVFTLTATDSNGLEFTGRNQSYNGDTGGFMRDTRFDFTRIGDRNGAGGGFRDGDGGCDCTFDNISQEAVSNIPIDDLPNCRGNVTTGSTPTQIIVDPMPLPPTGRWGLSQ